MVIDHDHNNDQIKSYLVISVVGLDLHPPEHHVHSVLLQKVVDVVPLEGLLA